MLVAPPGITTVSGAAPGRLVRLIHGQPNMLLRGCDTERRARVAIVPTVGTP